MNNELNIIQVKVSKIIPYDLNAKKHDQVQINNVAESIKQFGFRQPIVLDKDNVIIIGHCRWLASKKLKLDTVPCHYAEELTEEQVIKLRNLDNKLNESEWDYDLLKDQVINIDFQDFNIDWGIPDISHIDGFLDGSLFMSTINNVNETYGVTFQFPFEFKDKLNEYIKNNGKEGIVNKIMEIVGKGKK